MSFSPNKRKRDYNDDNDGNNPKRGKLEESIFLMLFYERYTSAIEI